MSKPFNKYFDHTLLRPDATEAEIRTLLGQAAEEDFAAVCVNGCFVRPAAEYLADRNVNVATVVGFPLGAMARDAKAEEARIALSDGADEIDMVMNISAAKDGRWDYILNEIHLLAQICHLKAPGKGAVFGRTIAGEPFRPAFLKVILETCLLTDEEIVQACRMAKRAGADFVKTSTGFSTEGASVHAVRLMKETVGNDLKIKASGGIRTLEDAMKMIEAGADRLGCSASIRIMDEYRDSLR